MECDEFKRSYDVPNLKQTQIVSNFGLQRSLRPQKIASTGIVNEVDRNEIQEKMNPFLYIKSISKRYENGAVYKMLKNYTHCAYKQLFDHQFFN